jgi:hypothetical protein
MPTAEARRRVKQMFEEFPSASYLTEIKSWPMRPVLQASLKLLCQAFFSASLGSPSRVLTYR